MSTSSSSNSWKMEYTSLGDTGLQVSRIGFGTMTFDTYEQAKELIAACRKHGINYFDNAEMYGNPRGNCEILFGKALKALQSEDAYLYRRTDLVITTKFFWAPSDHPKCNQNGLDYSFTGVNEYGTSRKHVMESINKSLKRLQLDYVDVIYAHRFDQLTPVLETVRAFSDVVKSGKAHYWGTSMWPNWRIIEAYYLAEKHNLIPPIVEQPKYSMFDREYMESHYLPVFGRPYRIGTTIWNALDAGILTGKYNKGDIPKDSRRNKNDRLSSFYTSVPQDKLDKVEKLQPIAKKLNTTMSILAVAWCLKNKNVSVILLGAKRADQLETVAAIKLQDKLTPAILEEIDKILDNKPTSDTALYGHYLRAPNARL